jgi:quinol monooxygenase YgiN
MSEIVVVGSLTAKPGREDEVEQALGNLVAPTHAEAGCVLYALHRGVDDPARFAFVERWESRDHLNAHLGSDHVSALLASADDLLAEPADIVVYDARPLGEARKGGLAGAAG